METNLLATFEASVVPALTGAASELADAREERLRDGVALSLPLLLGAIVRKCTAAGGPGDVHRMLTAESIDAGMLDSIDTPLADDGRALATSSLGANLLSSLFGAATDSVNRQVAQRAGLELDEARRLLALLTALMFAFLKRWIEQHDLDAAALTAQLLEQRPVLEQRLDPGIVAAAGHADIATFLTGAEGQAGRALRAGAARASASVGPGRRVLPWLVVALLIGVGLALVRNCSGLPP